MITRGSTLITISMAHLPFESWAWPSSCGTQRVVTVRCRMTLFMTSGSVEKRQTTRICPDQGRTAESKKLLTLCCYEPQTRTRARLEVVRRLDTSGGALTGSSRTKITRPPSARRVRQSGKFRNHFNCAILPIREPNPLILCIFPLTTS